MSSASCAHRYVPRSVLVAVVAALASCTDAATIVLKMKDNAILRQKDAVAVDSTAAASTMKENPEGYNFGVQNFTNVVNITDGTEDDDGTSGDEEALSAVWYLAAFGGLVLFFFVVTCSELFFGNPIYTRRQVELHHAGYLRRQVYGIRNHHLQHRYTPDTPPPPYHLFAPPSYDDTVKGGGPQQCHEPAGGNKKLADVYVVPVHAAAGRAACTTANTAAAAVAAAAAAQGDVKLLAAVLPQTKFK